MSELGWDESFVQTRLAAQYWRNLQNVYCLVCESNALSCFCQECYSLLQDIPIRPCESDVFPRQSSVTLQVDRGSRRTVKGMGPIQCTSERDSQHRLLPEKKITLVKIRGYKWNDTDLIHHFEWHLINYNRQWENCNAVQVFCPPLLHTLNHL